MKTTTIISAAFAILMSSCSTPKEPGLKDIFVDTQVAAGITIPGPGKDYALNAVAKRIDSRESDDIDKETIVYALDAIQSPVSLFDPVYTESGDTLYVMDQISDKKNREEQWVEDMSLYEAIRRLPDRERTIIELRFFKGKTQIEVAEMINISQAQVSRLEKNAIEIMKKYLL